jgi:hypothetical protein
MTRAIAHDRLHIARIMRELHRDAVDLLDRVPDPPPHGLVGLRLPPNVPPIDPSEIGGGLPVFNPGDLESGHPGTGGGQGQIVVIRW